MKRDNWSGRLPDHVDGNRLPTRRSALLLWSRSESIRVEQPRVTVQPEMELIAGLPAIVLEGEVDLAVAPGLQERFDSLMAVGSPTIVVDLEKARFLDSIALGVLVGALERCRDAGGSLHLIVTDPRILKVLDITGLSNAFLLHSSRSELEPVGRSDE